MYVAVSGPSSTPVTGVSGIDIVNTGTGSVIGYIAIPSSAGGAPLDLVINKAGTIAYGNPGDGYSLVEEFNLVSDTYVGTLTPGTAPCTCTALGCLEPCPTVNEGSIAISPSGSTLYVTGGYVDLFNHVGAVLLTVDSGLGSVSPLMTTLQTGSLGVGIAVNPTTGAGYWDYLGDFGEPPSTLASLGGTGAVLTSSTKMSFWNIAVEPIDGAAWVVECGLGYVYPKAGPGSIVTTDGSSITLTECPAIGPDMGIMILRALHLTRIHLCIQSHMSFRAAQSL